MQFREKRLNLSVPQVMGILNVTPDSFSDGGQFNQLDAALKQVEKMIEAGATIIDIGGESTRPGAEDVTESEELARTIPVIEAIASRFDTIISIDTSKPTVMREAVSAGAGLINDVRSLSLDGAMEVAKQCVDQYGCVVSLMHMQGTPRSMQNAPRYDDVVDEVSCFLKEKIDWCVSNGIARENIIADPGFGFGKSVNHNFELLAHLNRLKHLAVPIFVGMSRKSMIGSLLDAQVEQRLSGSLACAMIAAQRGANIIRVHDVKETVDVLSVLNKIQEIDNK